MEHPLYSLAIGIVVVAFGILAIGPTIQAEIDLARKKRYEESTVGDMITARWIYEHDNCNGIRCPGCPLSGKCPPQRGTLRQVAERWLRARGVGL